MAGTAFRALEINTSKTAVYVTVPWGGVQIRP